LSKKQLEHHLELLKLFLPEMLVDHFDLIASRQEGETLHVYFGDWNLVAKGSRMTEEFAAFLKEISRF
jgi:hypothetical protein